MTYSYTQAVAYLEALQIMPKTMPGLQKITKALKLTDWYGGIDPAKVIVVAGTNGKGTTCAALESLLVSAGQKTALYTSPHLITTAERIRVNSASISEADFVELFQDCLKLVEECELSHFEALTLMAGHYFFSSKWGQSPDFVIFEVGLGGLFDATNAFPHKYSVITALALDHVNILGNTLQEVAKNKFGIISRKNIVVHHPIPAELDSLKEETRRATNCNWLLAESAELIVDKKSSSPRYFLKYHDLNFEINILGKRAAENIMTAVTLFQILGFDLDSHVDALKKISWRGRMQRVSWPGLQAPLYLSGDHNVQGVESLIEILKDFKYENLYLIAGIGVDKDAEQMLARLCNLQNISLYLTETPFKGLSLAAYPEHFKDKSVALEINVQKLLNLIAASARPQDLVLVTGSLYLVGEILKLLPGE